VVRKVERVIIPVVSIPIPGGRSLRPVKGESFVNGVDQNFSSIFYWALNTFNKTSPLFCSLSNLYP